MMLHALGVYRESQFSPGKVNADASILDSVLAQLDTRGVHTSSMNPTRFAEDVQSKYDLILAMCQGEKALERLASMEAAGAVVINSAAAIRSCYRDRLAAVLQAVSLPVPPGMLVETASAIDRRPLGALRPELGIFIKRGDLHALVPDDVQRAGDLGSLTRILQDFARRGVRLAYLQQAVEGRVVKFYGVAGGEFFRIADSEAELPARVLTSLCEAGRDAARALGLEVWGGDAVVDGKRVMIVDFNDWPSFERVRAQAAVAIARRAIELLSGRGKD